MIKVNTTLLHVCNSIRSELNKHKYHFSADNSILTAYTLELSI